MPVTKPYIKRAMEASIITSDIVRVIEEEMFFDECLRFTAL